MIIKDLGMLYPENSKTKKRKRRFCLVMCSSNECSNEYKTETGSYVNKGLNQLCKQCASKEISRKSTKHGESINKSQDYVRWQNMLSRCCNENHPKYYRYGGRGISINNEWKNNYSSFKKYISSLENYGVDTYSLDRINNEKGYEEGNLRWANKKTQTINRTLDTNVGVNFHSTHKRYRCYVNIKGKQKHIGMFDSEREASDARNKYIKENNLHNENMVCKIKPTRDD